MWDRYLISFPPIWISNFLGTIFEKSVFYLILCRITSALYRESIAWLAIPWHCSILLSLHQCNTNLINILFIVGLDIWWCKYSNKCCFYIYFVPNKLVRTFFLHLKFYLRKFFQFSTCTVIFKWWLFFPFQSFSGGSEGRCFVCWPKPLVQYWIDRCGVNRIPCLVLAFKRKVYGPLPLNMVLAMFAKYDVDMFYQDKEVSPPFLFC